MTDTPQDPERDEPGWNDDDWDDDKVRADLDVLMRRVAGQDGADEAQVNHRMSQFRRWAAIEAARARALGPVGITARSMLRVFLDHEEDNYTVAMQALLDTDHAPTTISTVLDTWRERGWLVNVGYGMYQLTSLGRTEAPEQVGA